MHLHLSGFSETRALLEYGAWQDLNCNQTSCVHCDMADDSVCRFDPRWRQQRNTSFLAFCREEQQLRGIYEVPCAPPPTAAALADATAGDAAQLEMAGLKAQAERHPDWADVVQ